MQMGNKNMVDSGEFDPIFSELYLGSFPTIDQEHMVLDIEYLRSWVGKRSGCCRVASENGKFHKRKIKNGKFKTIHLGLNIQLGGFHNGSQKPYNLHNFIIYFRIDRLIQQIRSKQ